MLVCCLREMRICIFLPPPPSCIHTVKRHLHLQRRTNTVNIAPFVVKLVERFLCPNWLRRLPNNHRPFSMVNFICKAKFKVTFLPVLMENCFRMVKSQNKQIMVLDGKFLVGVITGPWKDWGENTVWDDMGMMQLHHSSLSKPMHYFSPKKRENLSLIILC